MAVYLVLGAAALVWGNLRGQPDVWRLGAREPALAMTFASLVCGLAAGALLVFLSRLALYRFEWARSLHRELRDMLFPLTEVEIVVLAAASSVGEELFFRGALMPAVGLVLSSAVFALPRPGTSRGRPARSARACCSAPSSYGPAT